MTSRFTRAESGTVTMTDPDAWRLGYFNAIEMSEHLLMRANQERFSAFQAHHRSRLGDHYYMIVVPKTLHLMECCLTFLPPNLNLFLILNGLAPWEREFLNLKYPSIPKFSLKTNGDCILHDRVLDMLIESNEMNFGVIDQDCFPIDSYIFKKFHFNRTEYAMSPFVSSNEISGIEFPRTFLIFFHVAVIKHIRNRYKISFKRCWTIPQNLEKQLLSINLGYHNFPHRTLNYFDNFQLIWAAAMLEGLSFKRSPKKRLFRRNNYRLIHVGAGSDHFYAEFRINAVDRLRNYDHLPTFDQERIRAAAFSYYAHLIILENIPSRTLIEHYLPFYSIQGMSQDVSRTFGAILNPRKIREIHFVINEMRKRLHPGGLRKYRLPIHRAG